MFIKSKGNFESRFLNFSFTNLEYGTNHKRSLEFVSNMKSLLSLCAFVFLLSSLTLSASEPSKGTLIMLGSVSLWMIVSSTFLCSRLRLKKPIAQTKSK